MIGEPEPGLDHYTEAVHSGPGVADHVRRYSVDLRPGDLILFDGMVLIVNEVSADGVFVRNARTGYPDRFAPKTARWIGNINMRRPADVQLP